MDNNSYYSIYDINNENAIKILLKKEDFYGASVTIPYKQDILKFLDSYFYI